MAIFLHCRNITLVRQWLLYLLGGGGIVISHGIPKFVVSDGDNIFFSEFWRELAQLYDISLGFCLAYHPHSDG